MTDRDDPNPMKSAAAQKQLFKASNNPLEQSLTAGIAPDFIAFESPLHAANPFRTISPCCEKLTSTPWL
jgi:hypothetical protein